MNKLEDSSTSVCEIMDGMQDKYSVVIDKEKVIQKTNVDSVSIMSFSYTYNDYKKRDSGRKLSKKRTTFSIVDFMKEDD